MAKEFQLPDVKALWSQATNKVYRRTHREINLVPEIKDEMIKTLKLRNLIFFLCIVVASVSAGITVIFGTIAGGQQAAIDGKQGTIDKLSSKLASYNDLKDFLTIRNQVGDIQELTSDKKVASRVFNILSALIPTGEDTITISELTLNLDEDQPTFSLEAQANAGPTTNIDYNVLDSFKKSMQYMRYDYGEYVDKNGDAIPAYCIIETDTDGSTFSDPTNGIYAYWTIDGDAKDYCAPNVKSNDYSTETYNNQQVVRIWRTPQTDWYKSTGEVKGQPYMDLSGSIKNVAHFESQCITYTGEGSGRNFRWVGDNQCFLVHNDSDEQSDGISISESSNGRDAADELVLRFTATIYLDPGVFQFNNTHMLAIAPSGHYNVTDSYVQLQAMFGERASDCAEDDVTCNTDTRNVNGGNNNG